MAIVQELHAGEWEIRVNSYQRITASVPPYRLLLTSDKAHFHLSGCVNTNFRYWARTNPKELHERPLHSQRVTVWGSAAEQQKTKRKKKKIKQILKNNEYHIHTKNTKPTT
jgi:hypothetical protein